MLYDSACASQGQPSILNNINNLISCNCRKYCLAGRILATPVPTTMSLLIY